MFGHGDRLHVLVEQGDVEFVTFDEDFAVHGFVFAELDDASAVWAAFDAFMSEGQGGDEGEEEQFGFHGGADAGGV